MFYNNYFKNKLAYFDTYNLQNLFIYQLGFTIRLSAVTGAIATSLLFSQTVLAEYCILTQKENKPKQQAREISWQEDLPAVEVTKNGRQYTITVNEINPKQLLLKQTGKTEPLDQMTLEQKGGRIRDLVLGSDGWLWIDRRATDYLMKVNLSEQTPSFDAPKRLIELTDKPCHLLRRLLTECQPGEYNYSPSLNRVFISGYRKEGWRKQKYTHLEFVSGEQQPVPKLLKKAVFIADIPEWNGALFRQTSGEALFYNGDTVIDLSSDFLELENGENFQDWDVDKTLGGRTFIGKFKGRSPEDPLFLMELKAEPGLTPVYLPETLKHKWLEVFTFANDPKSTLWIVTRKFIFAQIDRRIQTAVKVSLSSFIDRPLINSLKERQLNPEALSFTIENVTTKSTTDYLFQLASNRKNCQMMVDFNQPIILKE